MRELTKKFLDQVMEELATGIKEDYDEETTWAKLDSEDYDEHMDAVNAIINASRKKWWEENWQYNPTENYWVYIGENFDYLAYYPMINNETIIIPEEDGGYLITKKSAQQAKTAETAVTNAKTPLK